MKKSISKRVRITKTGKILRRAMAQGHFLSKKSSRQIRRSKAYRTLTGLSKMIKTSYR